MPETATAPAVTIRTLEPAEHARLLDLPTSPFAGLAAPPDPDHSRILVVETDDQRIVGGWVIHDTVHAEPMWLDPEAQGRPRVLRGLLEAGLEQLAATGVQAAFVVIDHQNTEVLAMAQRLGFQKVPGDLFILQLPDLSPAARPAEET